MRTGFVIPILITTVCGLPVISQAQVDIEVTEFFAPPVAFPGVPVGGQIVLRIRNTGPDHITTGFNVGFYVSQDEEITTGDTLLIGGREFVSSLPAGAEVLVPLFEGARVPDWYPLGPAYLGAKADEFNVIAETDETNNTGSSPVEVIQEVPVQASSWGSVKTLFR